MPTLNLDIVHLGDCLPVLRDIPDGSLDAIVTDPPYGLGTKEPAIEAIIQYLQGGVLAPLKQGRQHCANRFAGIARVLDANSPEPEPPQDAVTFRILFSAMVVGLKPVEFQGQPLRGKQEVHAEGPVGSLDNVLVDESDSKLGELPNDGLLCLRERQSFPRCVEVCRCFTQTSPTTFRVLVRLGDDASRNAQRSTGIVAARTTEVRAVLTLDVGRRTGNLVPTDSTDDLNAGLLLATPEGVGALSPAGSLLASLQVLLRDEVRSSADRTVAFDVSVPAALLDRFHSPHVPQKDFMGKDWQIPPVAVWKECYRVLKPGGHLLSFGGTRTFDLISLGIRAAGFENRDTIASMFGGVLAWVHGQGFPKSLDISKALDKAAGAEREVVGVNPTQVGRTTKNTSYLAGYTDKDGQGGSEVEERQSLVTAPATEDAKRWEGWGTALKPSWEPILVYRKPLEESTVARQVLATGTGGLNIDACRVRYGGKTLDEVRKEAGSPTQGTETGRVANWGMREHSVEFHPTGRWPSNLVLCHHPDCKRVGTAEAPAPVINRFTDGMKPFGEGAGHPYTSSGGGTEEVAVYECVDGREFTASAFVSGSTVCSTPLSPLSSLLGHVAVVLRDLRGCNRPCTTPLPDASEVARILHTQSGVSDDVLAHEVARALGVSALPDWRACCASCRGLCGGHVRRFAEAAQVGPQPLADALEHALHDLPKLEHTLGSPTHGLQPSSDAAPGSGTEHDSPPSRTSSVAHDPPPSSAPAVRTGDTAPPKQPQTSPPDSTSVSSNDEPSCSSRTSPDSACRHAEIRLLGLVALDLASCFLSVECRKIVLALGMCPVKMLDEQSGERKTTWIAPEHQNNRGGEILGALQHPGDQGYNDAGGASRFFPSFEGQAPPAAPFLYTSKASKRETSLDGKVENNHPCLHPDSLVMTPDGYQPIAALNIGSHVLSADGHFHTVEAVTQHPYTSDALVEIRIAGSNITSLVTDNHPYLVWRPERHKAAIVGGSVHWLRADEIQVGDYTMTPIVLDGLAGVIPPRAEDTEFWFLIGLYLAEGSKQKAGHGENVYPRFALHEDETDLVDRIRMYFAPSETTVSVYPNGGRGISVMAFDPDFGALCEELCGCGAATKKLHPCVWNLPEESLRALVEGYFAGDGGRVRTYLQAKTSSPHLGSQMRFLGEMLGYKVELQWCAPEPGGIGDRTFQTVLPYYAIRMNERNRTMQGRKPSRPTVLEHEGVTYLLSYVKRLNRVPYVGDVVNLSVEGSHTFQTAAGMSHNTKKPLALMEWLVKLVCPKGGTVLDPYCGSGTTCVAATANDMHFIGIERDEHYHAIALKRTGIVHEECEYERGLKSVFERMEELAEELDDGGDIYADLHKHG